MEKATQMMYEYSRERSWLLDTIPEDIESLSEEEAKQVLRNLVENKKKIESKYLEIRKMNGF